MTSVSILARLLGRVFPACAKPGERGLPTLARFEAAQLIRPTTPNSALAAPAGFAPAPYIATPAYAIPPARLYQALLAVAAARPRTFPLAADPAGLRAQWVVRSRVLNFPDIVSAQVLPEPGPASRLVLYSRSMYGYSDLGANRRRLRSWLAAIGETAERSPR